MKMHNPSTIGSKASAQGNAFPKSVESADKNVIHQSSIRDITSARLFFGFYQKGIAMAAMACAFSAMAQPVFVAPPIAPAPAPAPTTTTGESAEGEESILNNILGESFAPGLPFAWRKLVFRPGVSYEFTYGNGVMSSTNREQKTIVQSISPSMAVDIGELWNFNYTPSITLYSDSNFKDVVNHSANLNGGTSYEDWTFGLTASATRTSRPETETAQQTDQQSYSTSFRVDRQLNADLSAELSLGANIREAQQFTSSRNYNAMAWLNQQIGMDLGISLGMGGGFEDVEVGTDMTYERLLGRVNWHFAEKLNLSANGGIENREFLQTGGSQLFPNYALDLTFQPFDATTISVSGGRSVGASLFQNVVSESTSFSLSISQRLLTRLNLGLSATRGSRRYGAAASGVTRTREDTYTSYSASLSTSFLRRASASIFYSLGENESDRVGFSYSSEQVGFRLSWNY